MEELRAFYANVTAHLEQANVPAAELAGIKERLAQMALQHHFLSTIYNLLPDPAFLKDSSGKYLMVNRAFARSRGVDDPATIISKSDGELYDTQHAAVLRAEFEHVISTGKPILDKHEAHKKADGSESWVSSSLTPLKNEQGQIVAVAGYCREVTDRKKAEEFLHDIVSNARCILWTARVKKVDRDYKWQINIVSSKIARMELGLHEDRDDLWADLASPDELARMNDTARSALRRNASGYENEFKITGLDGSERNIHEVVRITPVSSIEWDLVGVAMDVTEQEKAEQELQKSLNIVSATVESTEDGVLVVNSQGRTVFFNTRFAEMWGIPDHIIMSCDDDQAIQFASSLLVNPDTFTQRVQDAYSQPEASFYDILKFKDGRVFERHSHPQRSGPEGAGRVWVFRDISKRTRMEEQLAAANSRLIKLVKEDALTGLLNRRTVLESSELEWSRWQRTHKPFSVLLIDVDDFKKINDVHGHITGDRALKLIADALTDSVRGLDMVGRYGGEEFIVILPETPLEGALVVAEKILDSIRKLKLIANLQSVNLTASIGVAAALTVDKDIDALIHRADTAMYTAKRQGKNRVIHTTS